MTEQEKNVYPDELDGKTGGGQAKGLTGYPSIDKPWLKYYKKEAILETMIECSIYEYLKLRSEKI